MIIMRDSVWSSEFLNWGDAMNLTGDKSVSRKPLLISLVITVVITVTGLGIIGRQPDNQIAQPGMAANDNAMPQAISTVAEMSAIRKHIVREGDTLSDIAQQYKIDVDTLLGANPKAGENLNIGDELVILPQKGVLHIVDIGDSLWRIANIYGVDVRSIITANRRTNEQLTIGETLFIPGGKLLAKNDTGPQRSETVSRGGVSRIVWPANGEFSSPFGYRWGRLHAGIDIANDVGTPVRAAMAGRVTYTGWYSGYGYTVMIKHGQGYETLYGHLSDYVVENGQYVNTGQVIAYMGSTGNSTGPHLHFEVHINGEPVNPVNVLP